MEFGRYLLRELLWEIDKFAVTVPGLTDRPQNEIEVLSWSGYDVVRLRAGAVAFEARLDWSATSPPGITRIDDPEVPRSSDDGC